MTAKNLNALEYYKLAKVQEEIKAIKVSAIMLAAKIIGEISADRGAIMFSANDTKEGLIAEITKNLNEEYKADDSLNQIENAEAEKEFLQVKVGKMQNFKKGNVVMNQIVSIPAISDEVKSELKKFISNNLF